MRWNPRLSLQIGLLYTALATINISFFVFMILENQTDLLQSTFKYHSNALIQEVISKQSNLDAQEDREAYYEQIGAVLQQYDIGFATMLDADGQILHSWDGSESAPQTVSDAKREKMSELSGRGLVFRERFLLELNEQDWTADALILLNESGSTEFLDLRIRIAAIEERMDGIRWHIVLAIVWGVLFHVLFGIFVYKMIFRRLGLLQDASAAMERGDLAARARWQERGDELDDLGKSFNSMANTIEEKVSTIESQLTTISRLNLEMQNELDIGRDVQRAFFPDFRAFHDYNPAFVFLPLRDVSGDMCSMFRFSNNEVGVFLGDAAGHGVSGALITALVTSAMDATIQTTREPRDLLESLNAELCGRLTSTFYATGIYVLLGPNRILYTGAGHVDCLLYRKEKRQFVSLESQGTPMGLFADMQYPQLEAEYSPGDRLILFSDGITEARSGSGEFGMDGVRALIESTLHLHGKDLSGAIESSINDYRAVESDDVTVLVLDL